MREPEREFAASCFWPSRNLSAHDRCPNKLGDPSEDQSERRIDSCSYHSCDTDYPPARWFAIEQAARDGEIGPGQNQQRADGTRWNDREKASGVIGKPDREHQHHDAQDDRGEPGSCTKAILSLQAAGTMAHRHRTESVELMGMVESGELQPYVRGAACNRPRRYRSASVRQTARDKPGAQRRKGQRHGTADLPIL